MASNNPSIGPLYPDIATADLKDEGLKRISWVRATHPGHWVLNFLAGNYINELVPNKNYKYIKKGTYAEKTALCISFNNLHAKKNSKTNLDWVY